MRRDFLSDRWSGHRRRSAPPSAQGAPSRHRGRPAPRSPAAPEFRAQGWLPLVSQRYWRFESMPFLAATSWPLSEDVRQPGSNATYGWLERRTRGGSVVEERPVAAEYASKATDPYTVTRCWETGNKRRNSSVRWGAEAEPHAIVARVMRRRGFRLMFVVVTAAALALWPGATGAHHERPTQAPDGTGSVPAYRSSGPHLVVCKDDLADFSNRIATFPTQLKDLNIDLYAQCIDSGYRHLQAAVDHVTSPGTSILV